jgi:hypothetical protein
MPANDDIVLDLLLGSNDNKNNAILKTSYSAIMGGDDIILSGVAWKRRSGFGKYSTTIGAGSSWEKRHFILTSTKLTYFAINESTSRGTLNILPERATITATYPGDTSQPTPYALSIKTTELGQESTKWKLCFEDRKTQLAWLIAITDIVADESVKEYNAKVLAAEKGTWGVHGFHRLYEEGEGKLFSRVRDALMASSNKKKNKPPIDDERTTTTDPTGQKSSFAEAIEKFPEPTQTSSDNIVSDINLPMEKLYQALVGVNLSILYLTATHESTSFLVISWWQVLVLVNAFIAYIFFSSPEKSSSSKTKTVLPPPQKKVSFKDEHKPVQRMDSNQSTGSATKSVVGAQLLRSESVPLSAMPSIRTVPVTALRGDKEQHRSEPLSEKEMEAHLHERWAQCRPGVDLSGSWTLIADDAFKTEYDTYLTDLGFNRITRGVACSLISRTTEITKQSDNGRELYLKGINPKGAWERTLIASGFPDFETKSNQTDYSHMKKSIKTADSEDVDAEAWWECGGTKHRSVLRGGKKGDYESLRYVEEGGDVLVCESIFHPRDSSKKKAAVKWRFQRNA